MELFSQADTYSTFENIKATIKKDIASLSDDQIVNAELKNWSDYFLEKYRVEPIELYMDNITKTIDKSTYKSPNPFYSRSSYNDFEPEFYSLEGYKITYMIPFDGDDGLLHVRPSSFFLKKFYADNVTKPTEKELGIIFFSIDFEKQEIENQDNSQEIVEKKFTTEFGYYRTVISNLDDEVKAFNGGLLPLVESELKNRRQKANTFISLSEKLNIPLKLNPNLPNLVPIIFKKKVNKLPQMPSLKPKQNEYMITEEDYKNIKNIINLSCNSMEKAAKTFFKLEEEELRDNILAFLNSHYLGMATGETFSKVGKTDIRIQFENKSAYIGECKIWHGKKKFEEALLQLFSYTTWRDSKTSLIIFNKDNKDFSKVLVAISETLDQSILCKSRLEIQKNEWQRTFNKNTESTEEIDVQIVVFDLCIQ